MEMLVQQMQQLQQQLGKLGAEHSPEFTAQVQQLQQTQRLHTEQLQLHRQQLAAQRSGVSTTPENGDSDSNQYVITNVPQLICHN